MRRRQPHSHLQIVNYWLAWETEHKQVPPWSEGGWDYGEPTCMACGFWLEKWDDQTTVGKRWASSSLQKCHVTPLYLTHDDTISNMVLMCERCHLGQPDSVDPQVTYDYMKAKNFWPDFFKWAQDRGLGT